MDLAERGELACRGYWYGMDVLPMSLINKMLQDLDARRADVAGTDSYNQQVRAVAERRRISPAWWGVLAVAIAVSAFTAWLWLRHPVSQPPGRIPLKLDADLKVPQVAPLPQSPVIPPTVVSSPQNQAVAEPRANQTPSPMGEKAPARPLIAGTDDVAKKPPRSATAPAHTTIAQPTLPQTLATPVSAPLASENGVAQSGKVEKTTKEFTSQQLAENAYRKALLALQQGRNSEAIDSLEQVLRLDARNAAARQVIVRELAGAGRLDDAIHVAKEGLAMDANQPNLVMALARLQLDKGELRSAIETMERALPYSADRADYVAFLAGLLQRDGKHKQAVEQYVVALQRSPQNGIWWMGLGISLQADNRPADAVEAYKRAKASSTLSSDLLAFVEARLNQLTP
ncbi:MAG TPA: tetratricopeptide repeat protein [Noviherbaspirillum sp.]|nr:tetratricopeptide repeat protein [Noviherbaspirillum sp.]